MEWAPKLIGVIASGVQSNWWGISCPSHCFASGLPSILASFSLGLLLGIFLSAIIGLWIFGLLPPRPVRDPSPETPESSLDRLRGYLHEPAVTALQRRRRRS